MDLDVSVSAAVADDHVTFTLRAENAGRDPVSLTFGSGQTAEFVVSSDDDVVWRWSDGRMFTQRVREETLAAGEDLVTEGQWPDPSPGSYAVEATLATTAEYPAASTTFDV